MPRFWIWFCSLCSSSFQKVQVRPKSTQKLKTGDEVPVLDAADEPEGKVLSRYDNLLKALVLQKGFQLDGSVVQMSLIDWCVCYGFQGNSYFEEVQSQLNYTVLHAALLLTIAMPAYMNPPDFDDVRMQHWFMALMGVASVCNLMSIISCTIFSMVLNRPYNSVDAMLLRITDGTMMVFAIIFDYIAMISLLAAMIIAGFNVHPIDGYIQLYAGGVVIMICIAWCLSVQSTNDAQMIKAAAFKEKYLDDDGQLKDEYAKMIKRPGTVSEMLTDLGLAHYIPDFEKQGITSVDCVLQMSREDLIEAGVTTLAHRLLIMNDIKRLSDLS